jgi:hypothetical protein
VEQNLERTKAANFLYLLQAYRNTDMKDEEIAAGLNINLNSIYVLKSRLSDKISEHLSGNIYSNNEELIRQLHQLPAVCFGSSREIAIIFLQKLEKDLLIFDMHNELLVVYSALKKIHLYSDQYYHYSQLYNRHVAFNLSLEKCEESLGAFNRALAQYNFSRLPRHFETLTFLVNEVNDHFQLNPSRQVQIIKNFMTLQLRIFTNAGVHKEIETEELLRQTEKLLTDLPTASLHKKWIHTFDFLAFEYYNQCGQFVRASKYFTRICEQLSTLLLSTHIAITSRFLISQGLFLYNYPAQEAAVQPEKLLSDPCDTHTAVNLAIYLAMRAFDAGKKKEAAQRINEVINNNSFKDYFHINTDLKLTLAFFYISMGEFDLADYLMKNVGRKIKSEKFDQYTNVLGLIKIFNADIKQNNSKVTPKQKDEFILFLARNKHAQEMLVHLLPHLKRKYA